MSSFRKRGRRGQHGRVHLNNDVADTAQMTTVTTHKPLVISAIKSGTYSCYGQLFVFFGNKPCNVEKHIDTLIQPVNNPA